VKTDELKKIWDDAKAYAGKYGRAERHLSGSVGKLHRAEIDTEICHQDSPSAQNYWKNSYFDSALEKVIKKRFGDLAKEALAILQADYEDSLLAEETQLTERLNQIRAIKEAK
jgi:DNA replication initiation complex subunit (GINS family)